MRPANPPCDHCGDPIDVNNLGQCTADTLLCFECAEKAATPVPVLIAPEDKVPFFWDKPDVGGEAG